MLAFLKMAAGLRGIENIILYRTKVQHAKQVSQLVTVSVPYSKINFEAEIFVEYIQFFKFESDIFQRI